MEKPKTFSQVILEANLPEEKELLALIEPGIQLKPTPIDPTEQIVGQSRIGGDPDLPENIEWPMWKGKRHTFVAQINLADLPNIPKRSLFPSEGLLSFFFEPTLDMHSTSGPMEPGYGCFSVIYTSLKDHTPIRRSLPVEQEPVWKFIPGKLDFEIKETFPFPIMQNPSIDFIYPDIEQQRTLLHAFLEDEEMLVAEHQFLGHPQAMHRSLEQACEEARSGRSLYYFDTNGVDLVTYISDTGFPKSILDLEVYQELDEWVLLFQLPHDEKLGINWLVDYTILFFMIRKEDLLAKRFDQTWCVFQYT